MLFYDRSAPTDFEVIDQWENGFGWFAHPDEVGSRASHAIRGEDGVWVFDPLEAPGIHDRLDELGTVAGIVVQCDFHGRDTAAFAERYDVAVHLPEWMDRAAARVEAPTQRFPAPPGEWVELGTSGITLRTIDPLTFHRETIVYRPADGTLRSADMLNTLGVIGDERVSWLFPHRFAPPREPFADLEPERILVGHGEGVFDNAAEALEYTLANARRFLPQATLLHALPLLVGMVDARVIDNLRG